MKQTFRAILFAVGLLPAIAAAQVPNFPQTLPQNTVVGRLGIGPGPSQAIPFSTLSSQLDLTLRASGTGAVPRLFSAELLARCISPQMYGAVGDGVADDTSAITSWFNQVVAQGVPGCALAGNYRITSNLTLNMALAANTGVNIFGAGMGRTTFSFDAGFGLEISSSAAHNFYSSFRDFRVNCVVASGPCLRIGKNDRSDSLNEFIIYNVYGSNGSAASGAIGVELNALLNTDFFIGGNTGGGKTNGTGIKVREVRFSRFMLTTGNSAVGLYLTDGFVYGNVFQSMDIEVVGTAIKADAAGVLQNTFIGGTIADATNGYDFTAGGNNIIMNPNESSVGTLVLNGTGLVLTPITAITTGKYYTGTTNGRPTESKLTLTQPATSAVLTILNNKTLTANNSLTLAGVDSSTLTFQATGTVMNRDSTDAMTNKTFDTAGTGNSFLINGVAATANTGTGALARATSPVFVTPTLGVASATSINKVAVTAPASGATLTIADGKTANISNTLTFTGTDGSSVAFGAGGTVPYLGATNVWSGGNLFQAYLALSKSSTAVVNGLNSNIANGANSYLRLTGPTGAFSIGGFTTGPGVDGYVLKVYNTTSQTMTIVNEDASSTAANRIKTLTGANVVLRTTLPSFATFIYDTTDSRWILTATN